eukprot:3288205-Pleurochrysis_carterae.AAC.1
MASAAASSSCLAERTTFPAALSRPSEGCGAARSGGTCCSAGCEYAVDCNVGSEGVPASVVGSATPIDGGRCCPAAEFAVGSLSSASFISKTGSSCVADRGSTAGSCAGCTAEAEAERWSPVLSGKAAALAVSGKVKVLDAAGWGTFCEASTALCEVPGCGRGA